VAIVLLVAFVDVEALSAGGFSESELAGAAERTEAIAAIAVFRARVAAQTLIDILADEAISSEALATCAFVRTFCIRALSICVATIDSHRALIYVFTFKLADF